MGVRGLADVANGCVVIDAPARLHLGFLDLNGGLGRRFGSLGLTIDGISTRLRVSRCEGFEASGPGAERALELARGYASARGLEDGVRIQLERCIPDHVGLGSGTQMSLAIGTAMDHLHGAGGDGREIARLMQRGARSGIGIGAFADGGFILDCGRGADRSVPPIAARLPFPPDWRALLIFDNRGQGLHGQRERQAFTELPEFADAAAGHLCRLTIMQVLPGILEQKLEPLARAIGEIQRVVGDHFAPAQGGRFASPEVAAALRWVEARGHAGVGQSSWGPTGFVLVDSETRARELQADLRRRFGDLTPLRYQIVAARNQGASVELMRRPARLRQN